MRYTFTAHSTNDSTIFPAYATSGDNGDNRSRVDIITQAIARKNSMVVVSGPTNDGYDVDGYGNVISRDYRAIIGKGTAKNGYDVFAEISFTIAA
jgi:hypothetical protein